MHVGGVATSTGETIPADLVVDAAGRRSPLGDLLQAAGARRPHEEAVQDVGYVYYARDFRSADGTLPPLLGPAHQVYDSVSILTIPADRGCWSVVLLTGGTDRALRAARRDDVWERVIERFPFARHWMHADWAGDVAVVAGGKNRRRELVVDGRPVATGVVSIGDAWAHTSPSLGRGMAIGTIHAVALPRSPPRRRQRRRREHARVGGAHRRVRRTVVGGHPRARSSIGCARSRPRSPAGSTPRTTPDGVSPRPWPARPGRTRRCCATCWRSAPCSTRGVDVLARPGVAARALELAATATALPGPSRAELMEVLLPIAA